MIDRIVQGIFLLLLIFSPLAFGVVETWSLAAMTAFSTLSFFLFLIWKFRTGDHFLYTAPGIVPLMLLCGFILLQLLPLPAGLIRILSPETFDIYKESVLLNEPDALVSLSFDKKATLTEFFRIISYAFFYVLTVELLAKKDLLKKTVAVVVVFASLLSFQGILQHILSNGKIFWIRELTQGGTPFGPYVNRNHYAGLVEMIFPLVLSLFLFYKPRVQSKSFRERISEIGNLQMTNLYILLGFSAVLIATTIFLTLSRSGIVSLCLSMVVFGWLFFKRKADRKRGVIIIAIFILIVLSVGWFGWEPIIDRFEKVRNAQGDISEQRLAIWNDSKNIVKDFPVTGTGFGNFVNVYPTYRTIEGDGVVDHAHNDYIEIVSGGGFVALFLSAWFLLSVLIRSYTVFLKRHETYSVYLFVGSVTGIISLLFHSLTDFNLHIGANGLYFFFLLGLAVSAAHTRLRDGYLETYLKKKHYFPLKFSAVLTALFLLSSLIFFAGVITGKFYFSKIKDVKLNSYISKEKLVSARDAAYKASIFDPLEDRYQYAVANIERLLSNNAEAVFYYKNAVRLNPLNGEYLQRLGLVMSETDQYEISRRLLLSGIRHDVNNPERYKRYALWLFAIGEKQEAIGATKKAISLEPNKTKEYITFMVLNKLTDEEISLAIPEDAESSLLFADYLDRTGNESMAEQIYLSVIEQENKPDRLKRKYFYAICNYYAKRGLYNKALDIMRMAEEAFPDDEGFRMTAGSLYERLGMNREAIDEYRKVLQINPEHKDARRRLESLVFRKAKK